MNAQIDMMDSGDMDRPIQPTVPPRPVVTDKMKLAAAREFIEKEQIEGGNASDLAKHGNIWIDGYELAKALDDYCGWHIDSETVERLEAYGSYVRDALNVAEREWFKAFDIQPPHDIGTTVTCNTRNRRGIITDVCEHSIACFSVRPLQPAPDETSPSMRWICKFENVTPVEDDKQ